MAPNEINCPNCDGSGIDPNASHDAYDIDCPMCEGFGTVTIND